MPIKPVREPLSSVVGKRSLLAAMIMIGALSFSGESEAIGLCPTPVGPIGIIPCDAACGGMAMQKWGADFSKGAADKLKTATEIIKNEMGGIKASSTAASDIVKQILNQTVKMNTEQIKQGMQNRTGLDAFAKAITGELTKLSEQRSGMVGSKMRAYATYAQEITEAWQSYVIMNELGKDAQPATGGVLTNAYGVLADAFSTSYASEYISESDPINDALDVVEEIRAIYGSNEPAAYEIMMKSMTAAKVHVDEARAEGEDAIPLLDEERVVQYGIPLNTVRSIIMNEKELALSSQAHRISHLELDEGASIRANSTRNLVFQMEEDRLADRAARFAGDQFEAALKTPHIVSDDGNKFTSKEGILRGIGRGRMQSSPWFLEMKKMAEPGLVRESAIIKAQSNGLRYEMVDLLKQRNLLLGAIAASEASPVR